MYFKTTKIECVQLPKYFVNYTCYLKPINRYRTLVFMKTYIRTYLKNISVSNVKESILKELKLCKITDKRWFIRS